MAHVAKLDDDELDEVSEILSGRFWVLMTVGVDDLTAISSNLSESKARELINAVADEVGPPDEQEPMRLN